MDGTLKVFEACVQGMKLPEETTVYAFDLLPNQFGEWSRAVWQLQKAELRSSADQKPAVKWRYAAYFTDSTDCNSMDSAMAGRAMQEGMLH